MRHNEKNKKWEPATIWTYKMRTKTMNLLYQSIGLGGLANLINIIDYANTSICIMCVGKL